MKKNLLFVIGLLFSFILMTSFETQLKDETIHSVKLVEFDSQAKECSNCGGELELCFTAYKRYFTCPMCKGTGRTPNGQSDCSYCEDGQQWVWVTAYVCKECKSIFDLDN